MHTPTLTPGVVGGELARWSAYSSIDIYLSRAGIGKPSLHRKHIHVHWRSCDCGLSPLRTVCATMQPRVSRKTARLSNNLGWRVLTGAARKGHSYRTIFGGHPTTHVCDSCTLWGLQPLKFVAVSHIGASSPLILRQFRTSEPGGPKMLYCRQL